MGDHLVTMQKCLKTGICINIQKNEYDHLEVYAGHILDLAKLTKFYSFQHPSNRNPLTKEQQRILGANMDMMQSDLRMFVNNKYSQLLWYPGLKNAGHIVNLQMNTDEEVKRIKGMTEKIFLETKELHPNVDGSSRDFSEGGS